MNVVYLSYTGLLEPLGQSQVLAYLKILSRKHRISLITFEKPADLADEAALAAMRAECDAHGIVWKPQRYHRRPRLLATAWDLMVFTWTALREAGRIKADFIHARSYMPALVALSLKWLMGRPFIFDMRGLWPEELLTAGRLRRGSALHRLLVAAEARCLHEAAGIVSLTHAAVAHLKAADPKLAAASFTVIPTCADLERFRPDRAQEALVVGCVGTVLSGWFRTDLLMAFFKAVQTANPGTRVRIVTRDNHDQLRAAAAEAGLEGLELAASAPSQVPAALAELSAAAMFFETAVSELGRCPTRMGEALGCGVPVVSNGGVGDVAEIIRRDRVGVLVEDGDMDRGVRELGELLKDPELASRCRASAEGWFSLEKGAETYAALYETVGG